VAEARTDYEWNSDLFSRSISALRWMCNRLKIKHYASGKDRYRDEESNRKIGS